MSSVLSGFRLSVVLLLLFLGSIANAATVSGQQNKWYPVNVDFIGPLLDETSDSPNPFLDYRLTVRLTSPSGRTVSVPGFFAGDGNGGGRGQIWRARFSADETGTWTYRAEMRSGTEVAVSLDDNAGNPIPLDGATGQFTIGNVPPDAEGFFRFGRLEYVGQHYMKFRDGPYWIKGGTDSPENLLGFAGIDGTIDQGGVGVPFVHDFDAHRGDWKQGDPLFFNSATGVDSKGIIGALNYLSDQGVNSVYFLPMNLGGDGQETFPFVDGSNTRYNKTHYDISKLHHWDIVLNHAQARGIALNIVLSETETENERWLDNGEMGVERKLFFRELIARFGYLLAVKWNLGEENDYPLVELQKHADYIRALDWSNKPIAVHTHINQFFRYGELMGDKRFSSSSIQYDPQFAGQFVEQWRANSARAGHPWVIDMDENTNGLGAEGFDRRRKEILYDVYFSGGNIEWYFGGQALPLGGDITAGDFRLREPMWEQMRYAREMMERELPFWRMQPADNLVSGDSGDFGGAEVFALRGEVYAVYLPATNGMETLNVSDASATYKQRWFDPRTGQMYEGRQNLAGSGQIALGMPPSRAGDDWVTLILRTNDASPPTSPDTANQPPRFLSVPSPQVRIGQIFSMTLTAIDSDGTYPAVSVGSVPGGMRVTGIGNGQLKLDWVVPETANATSIVELVAFDAVDRSLRTVQPMTITVIKDSDAQPDGTGDHAGRPGFGELPEVQINPGQYLELAFQAKADSDVAPVVTVGQIPKGMRVEGPGDGVIRLFWQVPQDFSDVAVVELIAFDPFSRGERTVQRLRLRPANDPGTTASAPQLVTVPAQVITAGQTLSFRVAANDADGFPPALKILDAPARSTFTDNGDGTRTFVWTTQASDVGRRVLTIVALDHSVPGLSDTMEVIIEVVP